MIFKIITLIRIIIKRRQLIKNKYNQNKQIQIKKMNIIKFCKIKLIQWKII